MKLLGSPYITKIIDRKYQEGLYLPPIQGENKKKAKHMPHYGGLGSNLL